MCDYIQVEYHCGHYRWLVKDWCPEFSRTCKRCSPSVVGAELREDERCPDCRVQPKVAWESMIRRNKMQTSFV